MNNSPQKESQQTNDEKPTVPVSSNPQKKGITITKRTPLPQQEVIPQDQNVLQQQIQQQPSNVKTYRDDQDQFQKNSNEQSEQDQKQTSLIVDAVSLDKKPENQKKQSKIRQVQAPKKDQASDLNDNIQQNFEPQPQRIQTIKNIIQKPNENQLEDGRISQIQEKTQKNNQVIQPERLTTQTLNQTQTKKNQQLSFEDLNYHQNMKDILKNLKVNNVQHKRQYKITHDCRICYSNNKDSITNNCGHCFHKECLTEYINNAMANSMHLRCPMEGCAISINEKLIRQILGENKMERFYQFQLRFILESNQKRLNFHQCKRPGCTYFAISRNQQSEIVRGRYCQACKMSVCPSCNEEAHSAMTCDEVRVSRDPELNQGAFQKFVNEEKYRACPKCSVTISRTHGCNHMTCVCKFQFCYKCGRTYKDPSCKCPVFDRDD